jgi:endonuclease YncB( thermonuclease family)
MDGRLSIVVALIAIMMSQTARGQDIPSGIIDRDRIAVVDGDTIIVDEREWRLQGYNTPKFRDAKCEGEHRAGWFAKRRLAELVAAARRIEVRPSGKLDRRKRVLGDLLVDGENVREILVGEGYARRYISGWSRGWCTWSTRHDLLPDIPPKQALPK